MNFSRLVRLVAIAWLPLLLLPLASCRRTISAAEKIERRELRQALRQRSFQAALPLARKIVQLAPNDDGAWARLAEAQASLGDRAALQQTLNDWRRAVRRPSGKFDEYRGDLALANGRRTEALAAWSKAAAGRDRRPRIFARIAHLEEQDGQWEKALEAWSAALAMEETAVARLRRAICARHLHRWDAALNDLHRAEQLAPNDPRVRRQSALFARLGKFLAEVRRLDRALAGAPNDSGLLADRALLFLRAQDPELALDDASKAAQLSPSAVRPRLFAALARQALGRPISDEQLPAETLVRLDALSPEFLQTISRLDAEIAVEPKNADLRVHRAWQLNEIGQPRLALADAESAIQLDPKSAGAFAEASYALAKLGRAPDSYEQIKHATELDPNFSTAWQYRGELEMRKPDYPAAIDSLTRALAINQTADALAKREECYRKVGQLAKADEDQRALEQIAPKK